MLNKFKIEKKAEFIGHHHPIYKIIAAPQEGRFFSGGGDRMVDLSQLFILPFIVFV
jgi:hypothetical protein